MSGTYKIDGDTLVVRKKSGWYWLSVNGCDFRYAPAAWLRTLLKAAVREFPEVRNA